MWWLLTALAWAAPADDEALTRAVQDEISRAMVELSLPDSPPIYHLRAKLALMEQRGALASFGGLVYENRAPHVALGVEVRVGTPAFDNTGFGGWQDGFRIRGLPHEPTERAIRLDTWRVLDRAYKDAVEQYSRKEAQAVLPPDYPGDYTLTGAVTHDGGKATLTGSDGLVSLAQQLSSVFREVSGLERGEVHLGQEAGMVRIFDTEGSDVRMPMTETTLRAVAHLRTDDGMRLTDQRLWTVRTPEDLPAVEVMEAEVRELARGLTELADAETFRDEYVGPVVFEGEAAADLFRWMLLPQLEGTPPEIPFDTIVGDISSGSGGARLSRRVLPSGWTVDDDPSAFPDHPGFLTHDWEGTPVSAVQLVEDGIVRDLLMSRVPRKGMDGTNGHGRGGLSQRAVGKSTFTTVTPPKALSARALRKRALKLAASYGHDHVMEVRRIQDPATRLLGDPSAWMSEDTRGVAPPVAVYRVYADGREERLRGARFVSVERWALRDIVAAGRPVVRDYLSALDGDDSGMGPTGGKPCRMVAPSVIVGELELVPAPGDAAAARLLAPPVLTVSQPLSTPQEASP
jgi:hypothetical protein